MQKGSIQLIILVILAAVLGGAAGYSGVLEPIVDFRDNVIGPQAPDPTAGWHTFRSDLGFEIKYPPSFVQRENFYPYLNIENHEDGCTMLDDWSSGFITGGETKELERTIGNQVFREQRDYDSEGNLVRLSWTRLNPSNRSVGLYGVAVELKPISADCEKEFSRILSTFKFAPPSGVTYRNDNYGFTVSLPDNWKGYSVVTEENDIWDIGTGKITDRYPLVSVRHPLWTAQKPRQDIPIMVFTLAQWEQIGREEISVSAAPIPPSELARNSRYVFALPARYNYAFPEGWEEVETILESKPVTAF